MLAITMGILAVLIAAFVWLFRKLTARWEASSSTAEWLEGFSIEDYAPMRRLLDQRDFQFLAAQPGYRPEIGKRLLRERRKLFVDYLDLLRADFQRLVSFGKLMVLQSSEDQVGFSKALWRQEITFFFGYWALRYKVAMHPLGGDAPEIRNLLSFFEQIHAEVRKLASMPGMQPA